ncbi:Broad-specificity NMP kinase [Amycolatopsis xylanica]|uniref:Broad-specificity NMP kinase n=1 Tax=Amycolatopsis xylanica TaxID=589385 RepID=A0A1H3T280_9PSEU|nr:AAA family ATPase [Amycolatopsis xylanica]SDZ43988.1 Broad-specificity NMP kinase [Amycolatopsis xylanica]
MLDLKICPACGDRAEYPVAEGSELRCAVCGHRWPFRRLPLFALTGPSGAGKSTVGPRLAARLSDEVVLLEQDVLWVGGLRNDVDGHPRFRSVWLRMAAMIHQSGRPVVLCGTVLPAELESRPERVFFSDIHYLALISDPDALRTRLRARPAWRGWNDESRIDEMLEFNDWIHREGARTTPPMDLFNTTHVPLDDSVDHAESWIRKHL